MQYVCVHGHFYQPPRENPSLEAIEVQDSAYPYHDWNERVCSECYAPNALSRILDDQGRVIELVNNYSLISFNFGPTLLSWMEVARAWHSGIAYPHWVQLQLKNTSHLRTEHWSFTRTNFRKICDAIRSSQRGNHSNIHFAMLFAHKLHK